MRFSTHVFALLAMAKAAAGTDCVDTGDYICDPDNDELATLCFALTEAGLKNALNSGEWTIFAPINQAFDDLGEDRVAEILADPYLLEDILLFHAVDDKVSSYDLECAVRVEMANGQDSRTVCTGHGNNMKYHQKGGNNPSNDMPEIIEFNIRTCQGYIHIVDEVLLPGRLPISTPSRPDCKTIPEYICSEDDFSTLCDALEETGLDSDLRDGRWTIFAPTDDAFDNLMEDNPHALMGRNNCAESVLKFHAIEGYVLYESDLKCTRRYEMWNGKDSRHVCRGHDIFQKGSGNSDRKRPEIIDTDIRACNGVIHVVDEVMLPPLDHYCE